MPIGLGSVAGRLGGVGRIGAAGWSAADLPALLAAAAGRVRERIMVVAPCAMGVGVGLYFLLASEPAWWSGPLVLALATAGAAIGRGRPIAGVAAMLLALVAAGFSAAQLRTALVDAPMLPGPIGRALVEGTIERIEQLPRGARIVLLDPAIGDMAREETPGRVRIRLMRTDTPMRPGDRIRLWADLQPPGGPTLPGAFDFRRHAFFQGIGGVGFSFGRVERLSSEAPSALDRLEIAREWLAELIRSRLSGDTGAIAVALMTGERASISERANQEMRDSGLTHLLSISGLHIGLVAAIVFVSLRLGLALVEPLALRHPIKKWAALAALAAVLGYTLLVGTPVPTLRSCVMTGLVLFAVMVDRTAISMRLVAWAAIVVLAIAPDAMLGPSFQMSFGAVVALIATYDALRLRAAGWREGAGWPRRLALYVGGIALTTLVATAATAPFAVYHFQRFAPLALAANLLAIPLTSFWIMPLILLAYLLAPLGLAGWALVPLGWGIDALLAIAEETASWPLASLPTPVVPDWGLVAAVIGGLWLCLARGRGRLAGLAGLVIMAVAMAAAPRSDVLVGEDGKLMAVRLADGTLSFSTRRSDAFDRGIWRDREGAEAEEPWPASGATADGWLRCDAAGCLYDRPPLRVALIRDPTAFLEDCAAADLVIAPVPAPWACRDRTKVIDRFDLWRRGAMAVDLSDGIAITSVADATGRRPWTSQRPLGRGYE